MKSKRRLASVAAVLCLLAAVWLVAEGAYAVARRGQPGTSVMWTAYALVKQSVRAARAVSADAADDRYISRVQDFDAAFAVLRVTGFGIGNVPANYKVDDQPAININEIRDGCLAQRPGLRKEMVFLRTNLFNPFDPVLLFHDADRDLPAAATDLISRFQSRSVVFTTNADGERTTLPHSESPDIVLVAGDSVANGVAVEDDETLASRLQRNDPARRYVNIGVGSANSVAIFCNLSRALDRYRGRVKEIVYVFCENDFYADDVYRTPADIIGRLVRFRDDHAVATVRFVYAPYIYNVVPEIIRLKGHSYFEFPPYRHEKEELLALAEQAGFRPIDFTLLARAESERTHSPFAPLALFVDHVHHSPYEIGLLADALLGGEMLMARRTATR